MPLVYIICSRIFPPPPFLQTEFDKQPKPMMIKQPKTKPINIKHQATKLKNFKPMKIIQSKKLAFGFVLEDLHAPALPARRRETYPGERMDVGHASQGASDMIGDSCSSAASAACSSKAASLAIGGGKMGALAACSSKAASLALGSGSSWTHSQPAVARSGAGAPGELRSRSRSRSVEDDLSPLPPSPVEPDEVARTAAEARRQGP